MNHQFSANRAEPVSCCVETVGSPTLGELIKRLHELNQIAVEATTLAMSVREKVAGFVGASVQRGDCPVGKDPPESAGVLISRAQINLMRVLGELTDTLKLA